MKMRFYLFAAAVAEGGAAHRQESFGIVGWRVNHGRVFAEDALLYREWVWTDGVIVPCVQSFRQRRGCVKQKKKTTSVDFCTMVDEMV